MRTYHARRGESDYRQLTELPAPRSEVIAAELERRNRLFEIFLTRGKNLQNSAYGSIRLSEGRCFRWLDFGFDDSGVRFLFLCPEDIDKLEAKRLGISPLVIYFKFGSS